MESNIKIKDTPKLKISSAVFGDKDIAGNSTGSIRNIHKTLSKLSGHVRKSLVRIKGLEEKFSKVESKIEVNSEKITRIKKILQTQKGNVGKKLPGGSNVNQSLVETNKILVEIQKQITTAFGMRNEEEKEKNKTLKKEKSKEKLRLKEGVIESVRKIGGAIKKTAQFITAPFGGFFDKILEFITLLGLGIGANATFKWFKDPENKKKITKFFNILRENWKTIALIAGALAVGTLVAKIAIIVGGLKGLTAFLLNPSTLGALLLLSSAANGFFAKNMSENIAAMVGDGDDEQRKKLIIGLQSLRGMDNEELKKSGIKEEPGGFRAELNKQIYFLKTGKRLMKQRGVIDFRSYQDMADNVEFKEGVDFSGFTEKRDFLGIPGMRNPFTFDDGTDTLEQREKGGPIEAGEVYEVGEKGRELFAANVNGSIINNMRTEKIYQMIRSKDAGKINFITMELPPKVMKKEQPVSDQQTAPPVPSISPVNGSNPYMNITPEIYGIYV